MVLSLYDKDNTSSQRISFCLENVSVVSNAGEIICVSLPFDTDEVFVHDVWQSYLSDAWPVCILKFYYKHDFILV